MIITIKQTLFLLVACLIGTAMLVSADPSTVEAQGLSGEFTGIELKPLPESPLRLHAWGFAYQDPCDSTWSNDEQPKNPCPTASPTLAPTIDWFAATTMSKSDFCRDAQTAIAADSTSLVENTVSYYYTVETTPEGVPNDFLSKLENALLNGVARDVFLPCNELQGNVGIDSISSKPVDTELTQCK